jgi:hypothetical protein
MKKKTCIFIILLMLFALPCFSQVAMKLELKKNSFIKFENIFAVLAIRNMSAHPLVFGENKNLKGKLKFDIRDNKGNRVKLRNNTSENLLYGEILKPGEINDLTVSLSQMYSINKSGKYTAKAIISHPQLSSAYQSNTVNFTVSSGTLIWKMSVGVPTVNGMKNEKIKERTYEIKTYYDGKNKVYCLIVSDDDYVYGVARIGVDLGIKKPECIVDNYSRLHILIQNSDGLYDYYIYDINCNLDEKESYEETKNTLPHLDLDKATGGVNVIGGKLLLENESYN